MKDTVADLIDLATARAMLDAALAHPWELLDDVAPSLAEALAQLVVAVDRALVHIAWLLGFLSLGGAA